MKGQHLQYSYLLIINFLLVQIGLSQTTLTFQDQSRLPLVGVTVESVDRSFGTVTDNDGVVSIPDHLSDEELTCHYLGFAEQIIKVSELSSDVITLRTDDELLATVEIVGRSNERGDLLPQHIEVISREEITALQASTSADVLIQSGDVYVQKSQAGGGSPVLRGFEANRVLLVVDGVRLNNLIYRGGHLQNAITVDHSALEQLELIFGPGSLTYGSDALGGVIHFKTLTPRYHTEQEVGLNLQFNSANLGTRLNAIHQYGSDKFASATSVTVGRFDDLRSGERRSGEYADFPSYGLTNLYYDFDGNLRENLDPSIQRNTGYSQFDILQKFRFKVGSHADLTFNAQLSTSTNVPRYDQLAQIDIDSGLPILRRWHYGPQNRLLLSPTFVYNKRNTFFDRLTAIASFQDIEESRIVQSRESRYTSTQLEKVKVAGLTLDFTKNPSSQINLSYGVDVHYNWLDSSVTNLDDDGNSAPALTRYPDGKNTLYQLGAYAKGTYITSNDKARITGGVRYAFQDVFMQFESDEVFVWPSHFYQGITNRTGALIGSLSVLYDFDIFSARVSSALGFRAPNTDDLAKIRIRTDEITVPNPDLDPERTFNVEGSLHYHKSKTNIDLYGYTTWIQDVILRDTGTLPDGSDIYIAPDGLSYNVTTNVNGASGIISGITLSASQEIISDLDLDVKVNVIQGSSILDDETLPLDHIPPLFGSAGLTYTLGKYAFNGKILFNGSKPIDSYGGSTDNPEYALSTGTPAWSTIDLRASRKTEKTQITLSVENLLDTFYRPFASGVNGAGRSYNVSIGYRF